MRETSQEAIASYFDDLLSESAAPNPGARAAPLQGTPERVNSAPIPELSKSVTPAQPLALTQVADMDAALTLLEESKKQQLQNLLNSQLLTLSPQVQEPSVVPVAAEPVATAVVKPVAGIVDAPAAPEPIPIHAPIHEGVQANSENPYLAWAENGRPVWAQKAFDVLLFQVGGLTLAVPLIALGHIHPLTDDLAPVFGQINWFMGFQPTPAGAIRTVDTALFVMPERYDAQAPRTAKYVISIDGMDWGLAVDSVRHPATLQPTDVTWRTERSKRPWLAGTVKSAMCALIDIPQMGQLLQSHDRNRTPQ